jgi:hypothetical protein
VFKHNALKTNPASHFSLMQHLVGDSAFQNDWFFVAPFKKLPHCALVRDQERLNTKLPPRVNHLDVVGRLTPSMNGNQEFTAPRSLVSQAGPSHWDCARAEVTILMISLL